MRAAVQADWMDLAIILVAWAIGMAIERKRGLSRAAQIIFTITMLAMFAIGPLTRHGMLPAVRISAVGWCTFSLALLGVIGWSFHKRGLTRAYIPLAAGLSAILASIFFRHSLGDALFYTLSGAGFLLLVASAVLSLRHHEGGA